VAQERAQRMQLGKSESPGVTGRSGESWCADPDGSAHQRAIMHIGCMYSMDITIADFYLTIVTILKLFVPQDYRALRYAVLYRFGNRTSEIARFRRAADIPGKRRMRGSCCQYLFDRTDDRCTGVRITEMFQHHRAAPDLADRIG
jgi:hypothetical protein